jgi:hypothetical protein
VRLLGLHPRTGTSLLPMDLREATRDSL